MTEIDRLREWNVYCVSEIVRLPVWISIESQPLQLKHFRQLLRIFFLIHRLFPFSFFLGRYTIVLSSLLSPD